jgi:hypothetical protein
MEGLSATPARKSLIVIVAGNAGRGATILAGGLAHVLTLATVTLDCILETHG